MNSVGKPAARMTDKTAHGGMIVTGDATVIIGNFPAARVGDSQVCPVTDSKPHVGGTISSGSESVMIGDQYAARKDDPCPCASGTSGQGIPTTLPSKVQQSWKEKLEGLGDAEKIEQVGDHFKYDQVRKSTQKRSAEEIAKQGGEWFNFKEDKLTIVREKNGDIAYTEESFETSKYKKIGSENTFGFGLDVLGNPLEGKVTHSSLKDYRISKEHDYKESDPLDSTLEEFEIGMEKEQINLTIGPKGGNNPLVDAEFSAREGFAETKKYKLIGTDGKSFGLDIGGAGGAGAGGVAAKIKFDAGAIILPLLYLRKLGYNIEATIDASADAALTAGGRIRAIYDAEEQRVHLGFMGKAIGGVWVDVSIGKLKPEGVPNIIVTGCLTVLIG